VNSRLAVPWWEVRARVAYAAGIAGVDLEGGSGNHRRGGVQACATVKGNSVIQHDRSQQNFLSSDILEPFVAAASSSIVQSGLASVGAQQGWQTAAEAGLNAPVTASLGAAEAVGAAAAGTYLLPAAVGAAVASYGLYKLATNPTADNMLPARNDEMQNTFGQNVVAPYTYKRQGKPLYQLGAYPLPKRLSRPAYMESNRS
jgi:hypothetical protein